MRILDCQLHSSMYQHILIPLENSAADKAVLEQIKPLARMMGAKLLLLHVADGWVARNFNQLKLAESEEMKEDRNYLKTVAAGLCKDGFQVESELALGNPPTEIIKVAEQHRCDLIAMAGHGHRLLGDLFHGSTITEVRHNTTIPLLIFRAHKR